MRISKDSMFKYILAMKKQNNCTEEKKQRGYVYVMSNPSMPKMVKIGVTQQTVEKRLKALSKPTGVPTPFQIEYECEVEDCYKIEAALKAIFGPYRVSENREFFQVTVPQIIAVLQLVESKNTTKEATADETASKRNPRFNFDVMNIPVGAQLTFVQNDSIVADVTANNKVMCNGKEQSLSALTCELLGYIVRPLQYWSYNGMNLLDIYRAAYR